MNNKMIKCECGLLIPDVSFITNEHKYTPIHKKLININIDHSIYYKYFNEKKNKIETAKIV